MKIRTGFVSNSSSSSFIISKEGYTNIKDLAIAMIAARDFDDDQELIKVVKEKDIPNGCGISFNTCNYRTYISETKNFYLIFTSRNHCFRYELKGVIDFLPEEIKEEFERIEFSPQIDNCLSGIKNHYTYWYPECDVIGTSPQKIGYCDKHYDDMIKLENGDIICPWCYKDKYSSRDS